MKPISHATPLDSFYHWEESRPHASYLTQPMPGGEVLNLSWSEVGDQARRMATHLRSLGLPPGSHIALLSKNCAHWIAADLAIWMAGHVTVPLYPTLSAESVRYILEHSESRLLFVGKLDSWDATKAGVHATLPCIALPLAPPTDYSKWTELVKSTNPMVGKTSRDPAEIATIIYTSGSTGRPKGVMCTFRAIAAVVAGMQELIKIGSTDRMLSYLPLAHVFERTVVESGSLRYGFRVFFTNTLDTFADDLCRARPTIFVSVPRLWTKFYLGVQQKLPQERQDKLFRIPLVGRLAKRKILRGLGLEHVRYASTGAAPLPPAILEWYRSLGLELLEGYGMTENLAYSHSNRPGVTRAGYVGQASPGVECRIADDGEIQVKSPGMMVGYFRDPEHTANAITKDGFLRTGDMGEIDAIGRLKITGRLKEQFKTSKGKFVAPAPIENQLANIPGIEAVCVAGAAQPQPHALLMLSEEVRRTLASDEQRRAFGEELGARMKATNAGLDAHERLQFLVVVKDSWTVENGSLTPTMKIRRSVIEDRYGRLADDWYATGRPVIWEN